MAGTKYDVIVGGTKAKIAWDNEGAFRKRYVRREVEQNLLSQSQDPLLTSRADQRKFFQSSWSGGATWWKPLLVPELISTYFQSNHMDTWSEPGKVVPMNKVLETTDTNIQDSARLVVADTDLYAIGSTKVVDSTYFDVFKWVPASDAWIQETGYTSGINAAFSSMSFDNNDQFVYVLDTDTVARFHPSTTKSVNANWITGQNFSEGSVVTTHNGFMVVYDGNKLYTIDKGSPALDQIANDGLGPEFLRGMAHSAGAEVAKASEIDLMVGTPEGLYYVKNVYTAGQPTPYVFRVDLNAAGSWIVNPIATLPVGSVALNITYHFGSIIVSTSPDWRGVLKNVANYEVVLYHVTQGGMGALGSVLGGRLEVDESPFKLLRAEGPFLYFSGDKRLWVYDAVRGGFHIAFEFPTVPGGGLWSDMAQVENSTGEILHIYTRRDRYALQKISKVADPDTVTNFGDDPTHYTLQSNVFDGNLPMELKELSKVAILHDTHEGNQEWIVQISPDDNTTFTTRLTASASGVFAEAELSGVTGYQFRYKLIYQTKDASRIGLKAVLVTFTTGEMIAEWDMLLDGGELLNVDNKLQDEAAFYTSMSTLAAIDGVTTLIDNVTRQEQNVSDGATAEKVKVVGVEIVKDKPGESIVRVVLRED